jgi:hypothetical protein
VAKETKEPELAGDVVKELKVGGVKLELRRSLNATVGQFHNVHGTRSLTAAQIRTAYRALTADHRDEVDLKKAKDVVVGHMQQEWFHHAGKAIPAYSITAQEQRVKDAKESEMSATTETNGTTKPKKEKRATVGGLIRSELARNFSDEVILKNIGEKFPESKATTKDIAYYRSKMRNEGLLPKYVRPKAEKKEKPAKVAKAKKAKGKKKTAKAAA